MRRLYPSLVLVLFLAAPLLQLRCAIACATDEASKSADACHHESATASDDTLTLASPHDCGEHAAPTAIVRANRALNFDALAASASAAPVSAIVIKPFVTSSLVAASPGGPPGGLVVPLRV